MKRAQEERAAAIAAAERAHKEAADRAEAAAREEAARREHERELEEQRAQAAAVRTLYWAARWLSVRSPWASNARLQHIHVSL